MGFLAPLFLGLAALAGVPLAVHLLRRRIGRRVDFPAVRWLDRMEREHSRELRLRHRLLLLLRVAAVLLLALAAARPVARRAGLGHAPVAVAITLDNSLSTSAVVDGRTVFDRLRCEADALLAELDPADAAWVVTAGGRVLAGPVAAVREQVSALTPLAGRGDLPAALRRAGALARSGAPRAPVVALLTDGQPTALALPGDTAIPVPDVPVVALADVPAAVRNRAVVAAAAVPARWTPSGELQFAIAGAGAAGDTAAVGWRALLGERTVARGQAVPGTFTAPRRLAARASVPPSGWVPGRIELDPDDLRGDDVRHVVVRGAPPPAVAVLPEAGPFLQAAVGTLVEDGRLARAAAGDAVLVSGAEAAGVRRPALLVAPRDPVRVGEANRTLARLGIPWRFGPIAREAVTARAAAAPAARGAARPALEGVVVRLRYPLEASGAATDAEPADTLATAGGRPWVVAGDGYVLVGSPVDPEATSLPVAAGFVPWLLGLVAHRLADDGVVMEAAPGTRVGNPMRATALEAPGGGRRVVDGDAITVPEEAGVYLLRRREAVVGALVVNPEPEESDVGQGMGAVAGATAPRRREAVAARLRAQVAARTVAVAADGRAWRRAVLDQGAGRSLVPPLALLALLLLLAESWAGRAAARGGAPAGRPVASPAGAPARG